MAPSHSGPLFHGMNFGRLVQSMPFDGIGFVLE